MKEKLMYQSLSESDQNFTFDDDDNGGGGGDDDDDDDDDLKDVKQAWSSDLL
jgi:hypothetical protein